METAESIEFGQVARDLGHAVGQVERTVTLLDDGNTVPFITRYRKDQTGGLDEEQIREIQDRVTRLRLLSERKSTVLKSIETQGKLTPQLARKIRSAQSIKRLEDLYLPYKPKKQTLATIARQRGLEPLATQILSGEVSIEQLAEKATQFVRVDRDLFNIDDVMTGVRHLLAERFSERAELRGRLRRIIWRSGKLSSTGVADKQDSRMAEAETNPPGNPSSPPPRSQRAQGDKTPPQQAADSEPAAPTQDNAARGPDDPADGNAGAATGSQPGSAPPSAIGPDATPSQAEPVANDSTDGSATMDQAPPPEPPRAKHPVTPEVAGKNQPTTTPSAEKNNQTAQEKTAATEATSPADGPTAEHVDPARHRHPATKTPAAAATPGAAMKKSSKKGKKKPKEEHAFKDYFDFCEPLSRIPPHRILAINRGERAKCLRVKVTADSEAMQSAAEQTLIPKDHPHGEFLKSCVIDALSRLVWPALEREVRRELTEKAERHAVDVFARNLRKLLLQPPVRDRRVLAIDPGFRNGCKLAALDQFGNLQGHGVIHIVGNSERRHAGRQKLVEMIRQHRLSVVAIGNGTACRETEQLIAELLAAELKDEPVEYVIVNEAGASVYSTSTIGREELPDHDPTIRSAISIGRRLLDPLSELVKINAANIGVGLYQHDVKASHLKDSLDDVVASCVNFVGVDINTASPALLRYVSGLNQLTARRIYEHRLQRGPFQNREQLRDVPGFGEATLVQAAGFLKITDGDNPLDATSIHPESYGVARQVLERLDSSLEQLAGKQIRDVKSKDQETEVAAAMPATTSLGEHLAQVDIDQLANELGIGKLLLQDILANIVRPGRDPREDLPQPIFRREIIRLEDLKEGMELVGTVLNVVDFGAFVDIGLKDTGLVHISRLADRFIADPHEVVSVGDVMKVWVLEVDRQRRRVALTAVPPGTERQGRKHQRGKGADPHQSSRKPPGGKSRQRNGTSDAARGGKRSKSRKPPSSRRPRPSRPVKPITKEMVDGKEPMRSFSDLKQFFDLQDDAPPAEKLDDQ